MTHRTEAVSEGELVAPKLRAKADWRADILLLIEAREFMISI